MRYVAVRVYRGLKGILSAASQTARSAKLLANVDGGSAMTGATGRTIVAKAEDCALIVG
jgi:hypothetical protein